MIAVSDRTIGLGTVDIDETDIENVVACLRSGRVSPGPYQQKFEAVVAAIHNKRFATLVNSGQSALHLALETLIKRYPRVDKVLCPAVTYISTLHAVWNAGMRVVLCDVDPVDWLMDKDRALGNYDALLPVDLFGKAAKVDHPTKPIIEDACEAFGAPGADYGDMICLSFYASHSITTGSGGMVLTNIGQYDKDVKRLCNHGRRNSADLYSISQGDDFHDKSRAFIFDDIGFSFKSSDLNAALGLGQALRYRDILDRRIANANALLECLRGLPIQMANPERHTFQMFPIVCESFEVKTALVKHLNAQHIETRDAMPIVTQPVVMQTLGDLRTKLPVAYNMARCGFYIGCHQLLTPSDLDRIISAVRGYFG